MTVRTGNIKSAYELVAMLKQLPEQEQLRVEGVIVGLSLARAEQGRTPGGERRKCRPVGRQKKR